MNIAKVHSHTPMSMQKKNTLWGYFFLIPTIIGLLVFWAMPMIYSFIISLTEWNILSDARFIGVQNYTNMASDPLVQKALTVTMYYSVLAVPAINIFTLFLASMLNSKVKGMSFYRTALYIPSLVPAVAAAALWMFIFNPASGLANNMLKAVGLPSSNWLFDTKTVIPSLVIIAVWGSGNTVVIYLAGLQGMPAELYEAATVDGAGTLKKFWRITVPLLSPVIFYNIVISIINCMQTFTQGYIMTKGGPNNASLFYMLHLYNTAFRSQQMGYACAMAWLLFSIIAILTVINFTASRKWVYYETGR